jgi:hypothetical protein
MRRLLYSPPVKFGLLLSAILIAVIILWVRDLLRLEPRPTATSSH